MNVEQAASDVSKVSPFCLALRAAIRQAPMRQQEVAERAEISLRTLQRYLANETLPPPPKQDQLLQICNVVPSTSLLAAELGYDHLIGSPFGAWADSIIPRLFRMLSTAQHEHLEPIDPRWAAVEANMIKTHWDTMIRRREDAAMEGLANL